MPLIYLVRHGQAAAGWSQDLDPPLSEKGIAQAQEASSSLAEIIGEQKLQSINCISSPIRRARETAEFFAQKHNLQIEFSDRVAEIPSKGLALDERMAWLASIMKDTWPNQSPELNQWRKNCINFVEKLEHDSVIFSHYIAINVLIGYCNRDDRVISYNPDNCSIHRFETGPHLKVLELGLEADTRIL